MLKMFHPGQLMQKYGGQATPPDSFWPPVVPDTPIAVDDSFMVSEEEYKQRIDNNPYLLKSPEYRTEDDPDFFPLDIEDEGEEPTFKHFRERRPTYKKVDETYGEMYKKNTVMEDSSAMVDQLDETPADVVQ